MSAVIPKSSFFARHWRGEARLSSAYWLIGVVGGLCVRVVSAAFYASLGPSPSKSSFVCVFISSVAIHLAYLVYTGVSIVRCSPNVGWKAWGPIAQGAFTLGAVFYLHSVFVVVRALVT